MLHIVLFLCLEVGMYDCRAVLHPSHPHCLLTNSVCTTLLILRASICVLGDVCGMNQCLHQTHLDVEGDCGAYGCVLWGHCFPPYPDPSYFTCNPSSLSEFILPISNESALVSSPLCRLGDWKPWLLLPPREFHPSLC